MVQFLNTGFTQMAMSPPPIFEGNDYYSVSEEFLANYQLI